MKKILFTLFFIFTFVLLDSNTVKAESFYSGDFLDGVYVKKLHSDGSGRYQQGRFIYRKSDGMWAYCIEPWEFVDDKITTYHEVDINNITDEMINNISLYAYYGYGYQNHTDSSWYYATQMLIWREIDSTSNFIFTDSLNGNKVDYYDGMMQEIKELSNYHKIQPNLPKNIKILTNSISYYYDDLSVLENYEIILKNENIAVEKDENFIGVKGISKGNSTIHLKKKDSTYPLPSIIYQSEETQDMLVVGKYKEISFDINVEVIESELTILKHDSVTGKAPRGEASLLGSTFLIYNDTYSKEVEYDGTDIVLKGLPSGVYFIKEIKAGLGYKINPSILSVYLDEVEFKKEIIFYNQIIENRIKFNKFYRKRDELIEEENVTFAIYDKNMQIVTHATTNEFGSVEFDLVYGKYLVKQISSKIGFDKVDDFYIEVTENTSQEFNLIDEEITVDLIIKKVDGNTKELITQNPALFKLYNVDTQEVFEAYTASDGLLEFSNLSCGNYKLEEVEAPSGYTYIEKNHYIGIPCYQYEGKNEDERIMNLNIYNYKIPEIPNTNCDITISNNYQIIWWYKKEDA